MSITSSLLALRKGNVIDASRYGVLRALCLSAMELFRELQLSENGVYAELKTKNVSGDIQTLQDSFANNIFKTKLSNCKEVKLYVSEENDFPEIIGQGKITVSIDPFDGSKAYRFGIPAGTIFGLFQHVDDSTIFEEAQISCSGVFLYGTKLELYLAIDGNCYHVTKHGWTSVKMLGTSDRFVCSNLSNSSLWEKGWKDFFEKSVLRTNGQFHHNMRWFGSLSIHAKTVILSGGLFAYPPDSRRKYNDGHLRLAYEAYPIAFLIETLGGACSNGRARILSVPITDVHQKTALVFGERGLVSALEGSIRKFDLQ